MSTGCVNEAPGALHANSAPRRWSSCAVQWLSRVAVRIPRSRAGRVQPGSTRAAYAANRAEHWRTFLAGEVARASCVQIGTRLVRQRPMRSRSDGVAIMSRACAPSSSPAPSAHRYAAAGLDHDPHVERPASMPSTADSIALLPTQVALFATMSVRSSPDLCT
jgi:hypothetical protein